MSDTCEQVKVLSMKWPQAHSKIVEDKANGPAVVDMLKKTLTGLRLVNPEGGKESRANSVEPMWESGNVWLPHPDEAPWVEDFKLELLAFPAAVNDDQVDAMSQALHHMRRNNLDRLRRAMENG